MSDPNPSERQEAVASDEVPQGAPSAEPGAVEPVTEPAVLEQAPVRAPLDVDAVAAAVSSVEGVAGLYGGVLGGAGTYLPGRRVTGVRETPDAVEIHVALDYRSGVTDTAARIREALFPLVDGRTVDVSVDDVVVRQDAAAGSTA